MARRESVNGPGMEDEEAFINSMKQLREDKEWTQSDLAKAMADAGWTGIYQTTISRIESGERPLRIGEARGIARVLKARFGDMMVPWEQVEPIRNLEYGVRDVRKHYRTLTFNTNSLLHHRAKLEGAVLEIEKNGVAYPATPAFQEQISEWMTVARRLLDLTRDIQPLEELKASYRDGVDK